MEPGTIKHIHSPTAEGHCGELTSERKDGDQPKAKMLCGPLPIPTKEADRSYEPGHSPLNQSGLGSTQLLMHGAMGRARQQRVNPEGGVVVDVQSPQLHWCTWGG